MTIKILINKQMHFIGNYIVNVIEPRYGLSTSAKLELAKQNDMPESGLWEFEWQELWHKTDFEYQNIIKITCDNLLQGLIRYAVYTDEDSDQPYLLEILHLEAIPEDERLVSPLGRWLIWYAVQVAFRYCTPSETGELIYLDSTEDAISYYRDIVEMESLGWVSIAPGEDGHAFRFTVAGAKDFCERQTRDYGKPKLCTV
ncbi:hypothetical protein [Calothrix sp. NIES-2098]|uniref:hypothetical protein n=1 Tax=Calothrix sp. NIES-2098 TaxID=1954171 RepID=UPI000B611422|nr:hypothetical protein NIES2098_72160 [Calothrix sp. NIES-2098]